MTPRHGYSNSSFGRRALEILWIALAFVLGGVSALAQSGAGAIQGTVTDPTGAVVPGAAVHVVNTATGAANDTKTNGVGFYSVPGLFAGHYTLTFSAPDMKQYETSVQLQVAQTAVIGASLPLGDVSSKVTVEANTQQLATYESGTISNDLDNARINQLPMNGRNIMSLVGTSTPGLESGGTRANGLMSSGISYVQDGTPIDNRDYGGPSTQADPDAIQEVKVETSSSNAMYAAPATAVITTKSGTNSLHGSLFETARNNAIGIARSRANPSNFVAPRLIRNEFGASVGGPIVIPKIYNGKDKSFFFFAYERYSLISGTYANGHVPTEAERNGDFSGMLSSSGQLEQIYDSLTTAPSANCNGTGVANPYCRTPFANNQIPTSRLSPMAKALFAITPAPTYANVNPLLGYNIAYSAENNTITPTISTRLDHVFNESNNMYLRYTYTNSNAISPYASVGPEPATVAGAGFAAGAANLVDTSLLQNSAALGYTHIFSPTFVSQTVLGNIWETTWANLPPAGGGPDYEAQLGLPNNFGQLGFPEILGPTYEFGGGQVQWGGPQIITSLDENLTKTLGRHQLFFGGRYRHERLGILPDRTADQFDFSNPTTAEYDPTSGLNEDAQAFTGLTDADFYLGSPYYYVNHLNAPYEHWRNQEFDAYIQDDYHVNNKLTVNLGLRWEAHPVATEKYNLINGFDVATGAVVLGEPTSFYVQKGFTTQAILTNLENIGAKFETAQQAGLPPHLVYGDNAIFDPRVGFAYAPFGSGHGTVFRAGYGQYSYPIPLRNFYASAKANEPFAGSYFTRFDQSAYTPDGLPNYLLRTPQTLIAGQNTANVINSSATNAIAAGSSSEFFLNPHYPPNLVKELNVTVEQPMRPSSVLRVSYVFDHASHLDQEYEFNNAMSTYVYEVKNGIAPPSSLLQQPYSSVYSGTGLVSDDRNGFSNYNALQANYQRLYKHGYAYQLSYVFARAWRVGGNAFRDGTIYPAADYAPGTMPYTDYDSLNRAENYGLDSAIPEHHVAFNGIVDLPIGRDKKILGHVNRFVNELVGGYQVAFDGNVTSQYFQPSSSNWGGDNPLGTGSINPIKIYKKKYKVTDCTSGQCLPGYLWYNGFISPMSINNPCGSPNVITGIPASYQPLQTPINMNPGTVTCTGTTVHTSNSQYLTNNVTVRLNNGTTPTVAYSPGPAGLNPFSHTFLHGPWDWSSDISLFKVFPITEKTYLRVNVDAFNAFNVQGLTNPGSNGIMHFQSSYNTPRQIQLTARLTF
jgi:hypothetical protein